MERLTFNIAVVAAGGSGVVVGRQKQARTAEAVAPAASAGARLKRAVSRASASATTGTTCGCSRSPRCCSSARRIRFPALEVLHLSELTAIAGLAAMAVAPARRRPERREGEHRSHRRHRARRGHRPHDSVLDLAGRLGARVQRHLREDHPDLRADDEHAHDAAKRIRQMTWLMIIASAYIAGRAVFDYVRGVNLVEGDRVARRRRRHVREPERPGAEPGDVPRADAVHHHPGRSRRGRSCSRASARSTMLAAIVCTKSRSGFLGLLAMGAGGRVSTRAAREPAAGRRGRVAGLLALPVMPQSFWDRMDSIMNAEEDQTGSREARLRLIEQGVRGVRGESAHRRRRRAVQELQLPGETDREMARDAQRVAAGRGRPRHLRAARVRVPGRAVVPRVLRDACRAAAPRKKRGRANAFRRAASARAPTPPQVSTLTTERSVHAGAEREGHAGGDGRLDGLLAVRVGRLQLDVLLRARPGGRRPRDCDGASRRASSPAAEAAVVAPVRAGPGPRMSATTPAILVDGRTPVQLHDVCAGAHGDATAIARVRFTFIASDEPARARDDLRAAPGRTPASSVRAAAAIRRSTPTSPRTSCGHGTLRRPCRIQMFHGVGGKYGFDAPTESHAHVGSAVLRQPAPAAQLHQGRRASTQTARRSG